MDCFTNLSLPVIPPEFERITELIFRRAGRRLAKALGPAVSADDVVQELYLKLLQKRHLFDIRRANWPAFVTMLAKREGISMLRKARAKKRRPAALPVSLEAAEIDTSHSCHLRATAERRHADLRIDVRELLGESVPVTRVIADALQHDTVHNVERVYGRSEVLRQRRILSIQLEDA